MKVKVRFLGTVKDAAGKPEDTVDIQGSTISDVISALTDLYGDRFRQEILHPDGSIKPNIKVFLNKTNINSNTLSQKAVNEGDTLDIFPPFYGG